MSFSSPLETTFSLSQVGDEPAAVISCWAVAPFWKLMAVSGVSSDIRRGTLFIQLTSPNRKEN